MLAKNTTTDAVELIHKRFVEEDSEEIALLEAEQVTLEISQHIYDLRTSGGQTQAEFGELVGVEPNIINALEEWDYDGDALAMLAHIEKALWPHVSVLNESLPSAGKTDASAKGIYPNALLGTTITGFKLTLFRYHPGRKGIADVTDARATLRFAPKTSYDRQHMLNELAPWQHALALNRKELKMFALARMNKWCHLKDGLRVNFSGNPEEYIHAVDAHMQLINAAMHYLHTGERTALKQWRQDMGSQEETRYVTELESALQAKTFENFPDAEWLTQTLILFAKTTAENLAT